MKALVLPSTLPAKEKPGVVAILDWLASNNIREVAVSSEVADMDQIGERDGVRVVDATEGSASHVKAQADWLGDRAIIRAFESILSLAPQGPVWVNRVGSGPINPRPKSGVQLKSDGRKLTSTFACPLTGV